ncbi:hypothetical protein COS81_00015 [candidate division WWE3 bacterium CG06_land_8_20_14_3_00_42_16]|uniref:Thioredoxin-like fold domain-containing protein n=4 Tax=Katanobacteria TaxID=422282 RepID=A0A2M7APS5_UNCKA|nr:MAG: hypothetical protein COS81_00015 [candidate division WWE3 bacterium CG06_land_8_20_14_3_00_42_16]PIZ42038.1 MAG: hypothetical protein COY34_03580 [candidate division WWE3 bacterium CG_4_10_14_0_2_um_filter_42_8]PJA37700.1 MAG: hypothetical protein CO181_02455 [candidate division WWE3 bacterium CG_4_9_14_3_um_filter_43_9]PJC69259.1 MAG: hypothetical protein CO015_00980 [candidate division WWE3 bacterium CG_4_8_14_3_um_filter_42_11]
MILKIFISPNCPNCPPAKELGKKLEYEKADKINVEWYDITEVDGMAEGAFYSIQATPSFVLINESGQEIKSWRGETPTPDEIFEKAR